MNAHGQSRARLAMGIHNNLPLKDEEVGIRSLFEYDTTKPHHIQNCLLSQTQSGSFNPVNQSGHQRAN